MSSSAGRRHNAHIVARDYFRANNVPCWECGGPPYVADHYPPISTGLPFIEYRSHCRKCSCKQGAAITNRRTHPEPSRTW